MPHGREIQVMQQGRTGCMGSSPKEDGQSTKMDVGCQSMIDIICSSSDRAEVGEL